MDRNTSNTSDCQKLKFHSLVKLELVVKYVWNDLYPSCRQNAIKILFMTWVEYGVLIIRFSSLNLNDEDPVWRLLTNLPHKVKTQYVHCRWTASYSLFLSFSFLKEVSTLSNMCKCTFLAWLWNEVKWKYLLCFINAHTAFLLCTAAIMLRPSLFIWLH